MVERVLLANNIIDSLIMPLAQEVFKHHYTTMGLRHKGDLQIPCHELSKISYI